MGYINRNIERYLVFFRSDFYLIDSLKYVIGVGMYIDVDIIL